MTRHEFLDAVEEYCAIVGGSISSGRRTWVRNLLVGGVTFSGHRFGRGADVELDGRLTADERARVTARAGYEVVIPPAPADEERKEIADRLGLKLVIEDDHDHLQPKDWKPG